MWFSGVKFSTSDFEKTQHVLRLFGASNEEHSLTFKFGNSSTVSLELAEKSALKQICFSGNTEEFKRVTDRLAGYAIAYPDKVALFNDCALVDIDGIQFMFDIASISMQDVVRGHGANTPTNVTRLNTRVSQQEGLEYGLGHVAIYVSDMEASTRLLTALGFRVSDETVDRNVFLRLGDDGFHHTVLLVHDTFRAGTLHHLAVMVNDTYSVFYRGSKISEAGYSTMMGPGRHNISSGTFWYFDTPIGSLELSSDMDYIRHSKVNNWEPKQFSPDTLVINHWVVTSTGEMKINQSDFLEPRKD